MISAAGAGCLWVTTRGVCGLPWFLLRCQEQWTESPEGDNHGFTQKLYGPLAKNQADGMEPIVTAFLEGTL